MFYSHTILSRKGPLGTVWIAAHLQHKLRKSQVAIVDISSSVDCIMFSEIPIALRLSGFLLLGVVRIYSKKVDYLYHDCNEALARLRTFASVNINLPDDSNQAAFQSITLPEKFELDALDLDESTSYASVPDHHLKTYDEITLTEQVPGKGNPYISLFVNEDVQMDASLTDSTRHDAGPIEEDVLPLFPENKDVGTTVADSPLNDQVDESSKFQEDLLPLDLSEIEIQRDFVQPETFWLDNHPDWPNLGDDNVEHLDPIITPMSQKENLSPIAEGFSVFGEESLPSQPKLVSDIAASLEQNGTSNSRISLGQYLSVAYFMSSTLCWHCSFRLHLFYYIKTSQSSLSWLSMTLISHDIEPALSEIAIQPTPPIDKQNTESRKRKCLFDESLVLSNGLMKKQLQDTTKLVCKRKQLPVTTLDIWNSYKKLKMDHIFVEPILTGMCGDLLKVFNEGFPIVTSIPTGALKEPRNAQSSSGMPVFDIEIEYPRAEVDHNDRDLPEFMLSPFAREESTPQLTESLGPVVQTEKSLDTEALMTPETMQTFLTKPDDPDPKMPTPLTEMQSLLGDTNLLEIPDLLTSAEPEVLKFLESDTPQAAGHEDEVSSTMSVRTRAFARYLKMQSLETKISEGQLGESGPLSLNRVLEGKTRKQCARLFFETLSSCNITVPSSISATIVSSTSHPYRLLRSNSTFDWF